MGDMDPKIFTFIIVASLVIGWYLSKWIDSGPLAFKHPLHRAASIGATIPIKKLLQKKFINIDDKFYKHKWSALHFAAMEDRVKVVQLLIDYGANINIRNKFGYTAMHSAVIEENIDALKCLVQNGADINARDDLGTTPLELATILEKVEVYTYLKSLPKPPEQNYQENDFDIDRQNLHWTIIHGNYSALKIALSRNYLEINKQNNRGRTPLHESVRRGKLRKALSLLSSGANPHIADNYGLLPLHYAKRNKYFFFVSITQEIWVSKRVIDLNYFFLFVL